MGYYTGTIFEIAHPSLDYSLGGGGRYDGMIGRFLGTEVPAGGFSIGFERIVDLVELAETETADAVVLVYDDAVAVERLLALKAELRRAAASGCGWSAAQNLKPLLEQLAAAGFTSLRRDRVDGECRRLEFRALERLTSLRPSRIASAAARQACRRLQPRDRSARATRVG